MSAVPPIASKFYAPQRKTPSATTGLMQRSKQILFDHLVGTHEHGWWHVEAERLCGLEVDR